MSSAATVLDGNQILGDFHVDHDGAISEGVISYHNGEKNCIEQVTAGFNNGTKGWLEKDFTKAERASCPQAFSVESEDGLNYRKSTHYTTDIQAHEEKQHCLLLSDSKGKAIGVISFEIAASFPLVDRIAGKSSSAELRASLLGVYIKPEYRRKGASECLMHAFQDLIVYHTRLLSARCLSTTKTSRNPGSEYGRQVVSREIPVRVFLEYQTDPIWSATVAAASISDKFMKTKLPAGLKFDLEQVVVESAMNKS